LVIFRDLMERQLRNRPPFIWMLEWPSMGAIFLLLFSSFVYCIEPGLEDDFELQEAEKLIHGGAAIPENPAPQNISDDQDDLPLFSNEKVSTKDKKDTHSRLTRHRPLYVIYSRADKTKVQLSFKYQILSEYKFYFGYYQLMFWNLFGPSAPFTEINYAPDFFYRKTIDWWNLDTIDLGFWEHLSNGRGGPQSRGHNKSYLRFNFLKKFDSLEIRFEPRFFYLHKVEIENKDIKDHLGFWEVYLSVANFFKNWFDQEELYIRLFGGGKNSLQLDQGGQEIGLKFKIVPHVIAPYIFVQYYHGYNEALIDYNKKSHSLRFGILIE